MGFWFSVEKGANKKSLMDGAFTLDFINRYISYVCIYKLPLYFIWIVLSKVINISFPVTLHFFQPAVSKL